MNYGICGYGNLGKAVEKVLYENKENIVGVFSRRNCVISKMGTKVYPFEDASKFSTQIDVMIMCGGSQEDLVWQSPYMCKFFNIIDTFDTHASIAKHRENLDSVAKESGKVAIYSCGWDPGIFSLLRALAFSIFKNAPTTLWGKGVSQGHSEALRNIQGVKDAIQFTVPNKDVLRRLKNDTSFTPKPNELHDRHCYICVDGTRSLNDIENDVRQTENYFKDQKVLINVCSQKKIDNLKRKMFHKGLVLAGDNSSSMELSVKMENNPLFTAKIIYAYSKSIDKLISGAYCVLEIPLKCLDENFDFEKLM